MHPLFKKLNFKDHSPIVVLHAPASFEEPLGAMADLSTIHRSLDKGQIYGFALAFVQTVADLQALVPELIPSLGQDAPLWIAYPKKSSKNTPRILAAITAGKPSVTKATKAFA